MGKLEEWGAAAREPKPQVVRSNTAWGDAYAEEIRWLWRTYAARAPRTLQVHLGPSELGVPCHRQVAGKMAGLPASNHVADPWPSQRGTALHEYASQLFAWDNETRQLRWLIEQRVTPHPLHKGTLDLYDALYRAVVDHKFLGDWSLEKLVKAVLAGGDPPIHYKVQLLLYRLGLVNAGFEVERVVLLAYPAAKSNMNNLFVWDNPHTPADDELIEQVWDATEYRRKWALAILRGDAQLLDVPAEDDDDQCYFCPFYRPAMAHGEVDGVGCPGGVKSKAERRALTPLNPRGTTTPGHQDEDREQYPTEKRSP